MDGWSKYKLSFATYEEEKLSNLNDFKHNFFNQVLKVGLSESD